MSDTGGPFQVEFVSTKAASAILAKGEGRMCREGIFLGIREVEDLCGEKLNSFSELPCRVAVLDLSSS